jgi:hypothetical protein
MGGNVVVARKERRRTAGWRKIGENAEKNHSGPIDIAYLSAAPQQHRSSAAPLRSSAQHLSAAHEVTLKRPIGALATPFPFQYARLGTLLIKTR